jgi:hypothetical protein
VQRIGAEAHSGSEEQWRNERAIRRSIDSMKRSIENSQR